MIHDTLWTMAVALSLEEILQGEWLFIMVLRGDEYVRAGVEKQTLG